MKHFIFFAESLFFDTLFLPLTHILSPIQHFFFNGAYKLPFAARFYQNFLKREG